jgi:2',3'-cyclic-nucleotide 2'-phosphodiesterase/3'-nucleotidase
MTLTRRRALQTGAAAATLAAAPRLAFGQAAPVVKLRVLETTDLHVNVFP